MTELFSQAVETNASLARAWKALDRLACEDDVRASEEFDHLNELMAHFNRTVSKPSQYVLAEATHDLDFDAFRADYLEYLRNKAIAESRSKVEAEAHNARLGPNYWCKEAFRQGEQATFDDLHELLTPYGLESIDETDEAVSEAYACILDIVEADFSHSGNLAHVEALVQLELRREEKHQSVEHARRILATCGRARAEKTREKRARTE